MDTFELLRIPDPGGRPVTVVVEYLDLDHDGVADAVRVRRVAPGPDAPLEEPCRHGAPEEGVPRVMALR
jgi:hypothetical protein